MGPGMYQVVVILSQRCCNPQTPKELPLFQPAHMKRQLLPQRLRIFGLVPGLQTDFHILLPRPQW